MVTSATMAPGTLRASYLIGRGVILETIRRKDLYILLLLTLLYMMGIAVAAFVGVENEATILFLQNLGLSFAHFAAHLLVLLTAARQIPDELEQRTIYPLLAKPTSRVDYILGKWGASTVTGLFTLWLFLVLSLLPWAFVPMAPALDTLLLVQAILIASLSVAMMAALAILGSLVFPKGVNILLLGLLFFAGGKLSQFIVARAQKAGTGGTAAQWLTAYIPDFSRLNLFHRYTDGLEAVAPGVLVAMTFHAVIIAAVALAGAMLLFHRRNL